MPTPRALLIVKSIMISILIIITSCSPAVLPLNDTKDINFDTEELTLSNGNTYTILASAKADILNCVSTGTTLLESVESISSQDTEKSTRTIVTHAPPLKELLKPKEALHFKYEIGINNNGDVVMFRLTDSSLNDTDELAFRSGMNLFNMKFTPSDSAACLELSRFAIKRDIMKGI